MGGKKDQPKPGNSPQPANPLPPGKGDDIKRGGSKSDKNDRIR